MEGPATVVAATLAGLIIGVPAMALAMYCDFLLGQWIADRVRSTISIKLAIPMICLGLTPLLFIGSLLPISPFARAVVGLLLYLMNAYPATVGFVAQRIRNETTSRRRFGKNVDDWLGDWECRSDDKALDVSTIDREDGSK